MRGLKSRLSEMSYAWVILGIAILGMGVVFGMRASFGAYISAWENEFSASRTAVTSISTLSFLVYALGQPLAGRLNEVFGKSVVPSASLFLVGFGLLMASRADRIWQLYALYGVVFSLGFAGCSNVVFSTIITNWFEEKRGFALGLASAGMAMGQLVLVPANKLIMDAMSWRSSLAILSVALLLVLGPLFLFFLRSRPEEKGVKPYGYRESANEGKVNTATKIPEAPLPMSGLFRQSLLWLLAITYFICGFTDVGLIQTHLFPMAEGKGFPDSIAVLAFSLMAISNIAGTIATGHLSDHVGRKQQLAAIYTIRAVTYVFLILIQQAWLLIPFAIVFGAVDMASNPPTTSLVAQLLGRYSVGTALGILSLSHHLGGAAGSWLPGLLYDITGSYYSVQILAAVLLVIGAALVLQIKEPSRKNPSLNLK